jgi:AcrR family transcriptional regulator
VIESRLGVMPFSCRTAPALPPQERSRATVDALVEATARILVKESFDKASTNRIAEEAGVVAKLP